MDDIDAADREEPLACADYVEDQYRHYREKVGWVLLGSCILYMYACKWMEEGTER